LRLNNKAEVNFKIEGNVNNKQIAPLILMTFIENVFKYGISNHEPSPITIELEVKDRKIIFCCNNKIFDNLRSVERTGIGIVNTKQRLQHLYPNKHSLNITTENGYYTVHLTLVE